MANITLFGGLSCAGFGLDNITNPSDDYITALKNKDLKANFEWSQNSVVVANMKNESLGGYPDTGDARGLREFLIYKTIGHGETLYPIGKTSSDIRIFEDFCVGDMCDYKYYIYPVCANDGITTIGQPLVSENVHFNSGEISIMGLKLKKDTVNEYEVDIDNIWTFSINVSDSGLNQNIDRTFYDTQHMYSKVSGGNRCGVTKNITGLLGKINCSTGGEYIDTYDYINDWLKFARSNCMMLLSDLRGFLIPCSINSNSVKYGVTASREAEVSFEIKQISDMDLITVEGRELSVNPIDYRHITDINGSFLLESNKKYLFSKEN